MTNEAKTKPGGIDPADVAKSIAHNSSTPRRWPSYTIPLPGRDGPIHVGAIVRGTDKNTMTPYVLVDIQGGWGVIVPVVDPMCAYTCELDRLQPVRGATACALIMEAEPEGGAVCATCAGPLNVKGVCEHCRAAG